MNRIMLIKYYNFIYRGLNIIKTSKNVVTQKQVFNILFILNYETSVFLKEFVLFKI